MGRQARQQGATEARALPSIGDRDREFGVGTYRRLPENVRAGVRRVLAK